MRYTQRIQLESHKNTTIIYSIKEYRYYIHNYVNNLNILVVQKHFKYYKRFGEQRVNSLKLINTIYCC